jgi:hypothetical protein
MIIDEKSFEAAVERVAKYLEHPPHEGTPQDSEFASLLEEIAQYQTELQSQPVKSSLEGVVDRAHDLMREAAELRRRREAAVKPRWSSFPDDGEGVGPTTGVLPRG